ncbi:MAG TPA: hypothetical protein PK303_02630 [bacterium]|nr:hypothetical protein [bacterium]HOL34336.1 hypothetical protein [bacterium]HPP08002.1 hypothetical protein [bacterium]
MKLTRNKRGLGLIELTVVLVLGSLAIFASSSILIESYKEWKRSNEIASLQVDFDLASHVLKSVIEEASNVEILSENHIRAVGQNQSWIHEFYPDPSNPSVLLWKNVSRNSVEKVITTLQDVSFDIEDDRVVVNIEVGKGTRLIAGSFSVYMRNS